MRKFLLTIAALGGSALAGSLFAEDDQFSQLDANKDGFITDNEIEGGKKAIFERLVRVADENGDKKLSKEEFAKGTQKSSDPKPPLAAEGGRPGRPGPGGGIGPEAYFKNLDKNADGKISKEEAPDRMKENFDRLDADKDGSITVEEFTRGLAGLGGGRPGAGAPGGGPDAKGLEEIFTKHDANSDGKLTKDEVPEPQQEMFKRIAERLGVDALNKEQFVRAMLNQRGGGAPEGRPGEPGRPGPGGPGGPGGPMLGLPILRALDADGDGEISKGEMEGAAKALAALDKNGDGKLSRDEILPNFAGGGFPGRPGAGGRPGQPGQPGPGGRGNPEEIARRLKEADKNGDGKISKDEAPDQIKERFDRIDGNGDGQLDETEIKAMFERMRDAAGRRPEGGRPEGRPKTEDKKPEEKKE